MVFDYCCYCTCALYSLSLFSLAESLELILEISATYRLVSYLLADNWLICRLCVQCMISNNKNFIYQFRFLVMVCLLLFSLKQCIIKRLLDLAFVISKIIKVSVHCKCYQPQPWAPLITLTLTLIIPDMTKTSSNNCFLVVLHWTVGQKTNQYLHVSERT